MSNKKINLNCISNSRLFLLGIATLLVTFFHSDKLIIDNVININIVADILKFIQRIGNFGVDIFLLLSGIGLYFSLSKNKIGTFYKNRFIRIMPVFVIITVVYAVITKTMTIRDVLETLFFISFFIKGIQDIWFMPFIMVLYLIFPLIYKIIKDNDLKGLIILLFMTVLFNLLYSIIFPSSYIRIELALTRIPVFLMGVYLGKMILLKKNISYRMLIISFLIQFVITFILYLNYTIVAFSVFARYLYCILAVCGVINISFLLSLLKNKNVLFVKLIEFFGKYSLEIYLIFEKVEYVLNNLYKYNSIILFYGLCFIITLLLSIFIKKFIDIMIVLFNKIFMMVRKYKLENGIKV